jgi:hypothetical protein
MVMKVRTVVEMAGYPENHVNETMLKIIENLKAEVGIRVVNEQIAEAHLVKELYSAFVEFEMEVDTFDRLINFCNNYMPSSIEILDANEVKLSVEEFRKGMNDMLSTMHKNHMIAFNLQQKLIMREQQLGLYSTQAEEENIGDDVPKMTETRDINSPQP